MKQRNLFIVVAFLMVAIAIISRVVPHPPNFVPLAAIAIVVAYYFETKYGFLIPLVAMFISDAFIGFYDPKVMATVYISYFSIWLLGRWAKSTKEKLSLMPATLFGSILFFVTTNFAVWAFTPYYLKTFSGLMMSYAMGIPFFKWTLAGDVLYVGIFVGIIEGVKYLVCNRQAKFCFFENNAKL